jgi:hypothetical protein
VVNLYQTKDDVKGDLIEVFGAGVYFLLATLILPQLALFFGGAIEESINLTKYTFYNSTLGIVFAFIIAIKLINISAYVFKWKFEIPFFLHDPELSPLRNFKIATDPRVIVLFMLIISSLNTLSALSQTAIPTLQQQVTETAQITFAIYPASPSETMTMIALLCVLVLMPNFYLWRYGINLKKLPLINKMFKKDVFLGKYPIYVFFAINIILFTVGSAMYGYALHFYRYGSDQTSIQSVELFWGISGFMTAVSGSAIPSLIQHDTNNGILSAQSLYSSNVVASYTSIFLLILIIMFIALVIYLNGKDKDIFVNEYKEGLRD